jgi:hypothetical protein
MKLHIFSRELEVLEYSTKVIPSPEEIGRQVQENQRLMGNEPWPSVQLEAFTYDEATLVFASPVRVYFPAVLTAAMGD